VGRSAVHRTRGTPHHERQCVNIPCSERWPRHGALLLLVEKDLATPLQRDAMGSTILQPEGPGIARMRPKRYSAVHSRSATCSLPLFGLMSDFVSANASDRTGEQASSPAGINSRR
jgi:hypothetical protein